MRSIEDEIGDVVQFFSAVSGRPVDPTIANIIREEGNYEEWTQDGYLCRIRRPPKLLAWCGYVRVPKGHPAYAQDYDNIDVDVHGGLTYSANDFPIDDGELIEEGFWWIGFDCAHGGDYVPGMNGMEYAHEYRNKLYVKDQVRELVIQLGNMK